MIQILQLLATVDFLFEFAAILHGLWSDGITRGRAIMAQPDFLLYNSSKGGTNTQNLFQYKIFFNPISHGLWYDVITRGRAIMAQPDFLVYNSAKSSTNTQNLFPDKIFDI